MTNFTFTPITIQELNATVKGEGGAVSSKIVGYRLTQSIEVQSTNVEQIIQLDRDSTALVEQGILFTADNPKFIYSKASDAKIEMLAEATKDARARAEQIASQGDRVIAQLRDAKMGVFQIAPLHSVETRWDGMNDTTALEKTITAVVTASFTLR